MQPGSKAQAVVPHVAPLDCGAGFSAFISPKAAELLRWGQNNSGQLGDGSTTSRDGRVVKELKLVLEGGPSPVMHVSQIACGSHHILALTNTCRLFAWGDNQCGQLGLGDTQPRHAPTHVSVFDNPDLWMISAGDLHSLVLMKNEKAYAFGLNRSGQLGTGSTDPIVNLPSPVAPAAGPMPMELRFRSIACGASHTVGVDLMGAVFVWGSNEKGQLGLPMDAKNPSFRVPQPLTAARALAPCVRACCGSAETFLMTLAGTVCFGANNTGQLGISADRAGKGESKFDPEPLALPDGSPILYVASRSGHTLAISAKHELWSWGLNTNGQLGLGHKQAMRPSPEKVAAFEEGSVVWVACGENFSLLLDQKLRVYGWGSAAAGRLPGKTADMVEPSMLDAVLL